MSLNSLVSCLLRPVEMVGAGLTIRLPEETESFETNIKAQVFKSRVRVIEFFRDFDKLHNGRISVAQFRRGLTAAKLAVSDEDFASLTAKFGTSDGNIDYIKFSDMVEEGVSSIPRILSHLFDSLRTQTSGEVSH